MSPKRTPNLYRLKVISIFNNGTTGAIGPTDTYSTIGADGFTHISLAFFLWDIGKYNSPRCDAAKRSVPSGVILFANVNFIENEIKMKNYP